MANFNATLGLLLTLKLQKNPTCPWSIWNITMSWVTMSIWCYWKLSYLMKILYWFKTFIMLSINCKIQWITSELKISYFQKHMNKFVEEIHVSMTKIYSEIKVKKNTLAKLYIHICLPKQVLHIIIIRQRLSRASKEKQRSSYVFHSSKFWNILNYLFT